MVVDFRREIGSEPAQFGRGWDLPGRVRWYRCAPGAKPLPFLHAFLDPRWEDEHSKEFEGPGCYETPKTYEDQPISVPAGDHYHGTPEQWAYGITEAEWAARGEAPARPECLLLDQPCHAEYPGFIWAACGRIATLRRQHCCALPRVLNDGWQVWGSYTQGIAPLLLLQTRPYGSLGPITTHQIPIPTHGGNSLGYLLYTAEGDTELVSSAVYGQGAALVFNLGVKDPATVPTT